MTRTFGAASARRTTSRRRASSPSSAPCPCASTRLEPDPVQPLGLHAPRVRHELHRDAARADPRELPHPPHLLLGPPLLRRRTPAGVQALPADPEGRGRRGAARRALIRGLMQRARSLLREGRRPPCAWSQPPPCARCAAAAPKIAPPRFFPRPRFGAPCPPSKAGRACF